MNPNDKFTVETITWFQRWTPNLFSFRTTRSKTFRFAPGQFARLGVMKSNGSMVWRAYSMVSADYDDFLEFYSVVVPDGEFTTALSSLDVGATIAVEKTSYGYLTTAQFEQRTDTATHDEAQQRDLWLLSTGTGLAPFLSILSDPYVWEHYRRLILVHSVRVAAELTYREQIDAYHHNELLNTHACKLVYIPVITREPLPDIANVLDARITTLIIDGRLEKVAGCTLSLDASRIMLCGNPAMVSDTRQLLKGRGFTTARSTRPGQIAVENYW